MKTRNLRAGDRVFLSRTSISTRSSSTRSGRATGTSWRRAWKAPVRHESEAFCRGDVNKPPGPRADQMRKMVHRSAGVRPALRATRKGPELSPRLVYARQRPLRGPRQRDRGRTAWSYAAVPESLRRVRNDIADFAREAGAPDRVVEAVRQACSEAAANAVEHAYEGEPGRILVRAELEGAAIQLVVSDRGRGLAFGNRRPGRGLGFIWMLWLGDSMTLDSSETGGLQVTMLFSLN